MAKHTPTPWAVRISAGRQHFEVRAPFGAGTAPLFDIMRALDERRANAHLIAAAPDLLEACRAALAVLVPDVAVPETEAEAEAFLARADAAHAQIERAISKAEGR